MMSTISYVGEAVYVDDIPSPANCLYGAFIYSTKPLARVKGIRIPSSVPSNSVSSIISIQDIPDGGQNVGSLTIFGFEPLLADELAHCAGQPIALVVIQLLILQLFPACIGYNGIWSQLKFVPLLCR